MAVRGAKRIQEEVETIWVKCPSCQEILFRKELERRLFVCPRCAYHHRLSVEQRLMLIVDRGS
ncbi:MAG: acetyl-CoA carboxylase carboxyl transferase subunit beta, partial [Deltaproteobacteria bacterium]|nr:acetyl-CoA carboxylase carboxyl transferase subunit beta [Deltaproteobacteria bacterium]